MEGRAGTLVLQHGGIDDRVAPRWFGQIVRGSGTRVTLTYAL
jgi:hypothetical protein